MSLDPTSRSFAFCHIEPVIYVVGLSQFILKWNYWLVFIMDTDFLMYEVETEFCVSFSRLKGPLDCKKRSADPRDKILGLIRTAPVVRDRFCFNSPNNDVNEVLICNSFIVNTSVRLFRKTTSLSRFEILRNLCPSCTVATIPTNQHDFSCHFPSHIFTCASL